MLNDILSPLALRSKMPLPRASRSALFHTACIDRVSSASCDGNILVIETEGSDGAVGCPGNDTANNCIDGGGAPEEVARLDG